jgi:hypothetical protein
VSSEAVVGLASTSGEIGVSDGRVGGKVAALTSPWTIVSVDGAGPVQATRSIEMATGFQNFRTINLVSFSGKIWFQIRLDKLHLLLWKKTRHPEARNEKQSRLHQVAISGSKNEMLHFVQHDRFLLDINQMQSMPKRLVLCKKHPFIPRTRYFVTLRVNYPAASCGASTAEQSSWGLPPPNPRLPIHPASKLTGILGILIKDCRLMSF